MTLRKLFLALSITAWAAFAAEPPVENNSLTPTTLVPMVTDKNPAVVNSTVKEKTLEEWLAKSKKCTNFALIGFVPGALSLASGPIRRTVVLPALITYAAAEITYTVCMKLR